MENITQRILFLIEYLELTASQFAEKIDIQRSSLSHILSERNKPSLDFILKIHHTFPNINLYWLLYGTEPFIFNDFNTEISNMANWKETSENTEKSAIFEDEINKPKEEITPQNVQVEIVPPQETPEIKNKVTNTPTCTETDFITFFYSDGTYKVYTQRK